MACPLCGKCKTCGGSGCKCSKVDILNHRLKKNPMKLANGKVISSAKELSDETEPLLEGKRTGYRNSKGEFILLR